MQPTRRNPFDLSFDFLNLPLFFDLDFLENDSSKTNYCPLSNLNPPENEGEELEVDPSSNSKPSIKEKERLEKK